MVQKHIADTICHRLVKYAISCFTNIINVDAVYVSVIFSLTCAQVVRFPGVMVCQAHSDGTPRGGWCGVWCMVRMFGIIHSTDQCWVLHRWTD